MLDPFGKLMFEGFLIRASNVDNSPLSVKHLYPNGPIIKKSTETIPENVYFRTARANRSDAIRHFMGDFPHI